jgi:hypothetical protein
VHETAPHLTENLRRALSERRRADSIGTGNPSTISLEYPLGPSPPHPVSIFPFVDAANDAGPSTTDLGTAEFFSSSMNTTRSDHPPASDNNGLFDGAHFSSFSPLRPDSIRFEVMSSNTLGEDSTMFAFDTSADPIKSTSGGQTFTRGGHVIPPF